MGREIPGGRASTGAVVTIEIHPDAQVSALADIEPSQRGTRIVVEARVVIDSFVKIKPAGGSGDVIIGEASIINSGCVLYTGNGIRIGRMVSVAANCTFAPTNHAFADRQRPIQQQGFMPSRGGIVVDDDVWIGAGCVLLDGARLRAGCVVAAGSIVRGEVAAYTVVGSAAGRETLRVLGKRR
jgi:virginiamycin A acetyltransferase